eukprot:8406888-Pyramimonas_sp.AAC.1
MTTSSCSSARWVTRCRRSKFNQPSGAAEICAMIFAILWLLQLQTAVGESGKHMQLPVISFYTDNNYVVDI